MWVLGWGGGRCLGPISYPQVPDTTFRERQLSPMHHFQELRQESLSHPAATHMVCEQRRKGSVNRTHTGHRLWVCLFIPHRFV